MKNLLISFIYLFSKIQKNFIKNHKKFLSIFLVLIIILNLIPSKFIIANRQSPVVDFFLTDFSNLQNKTYTLNFRWKKPNSSLAYDYAAIPEDSTTLHEIKNYDLFNKNITKRENYPNFPMYSIEDPSEFVTRQYDFNFDSGSLYMFKVVPYHFHTYLKDTQSGGTVVVKERAPMDYSNTLNKEILYLSDINLSARGVDKDLIITWDNPTFSAREIFDNYRIYYSLGGHELSQVPTSNYIDVNIKDPYLKRTKDGKFEYRFTDTNLQIGKSYAIKIEPMIGNKLVRSLNKILIDTKEYDIAYTNPAREYRINGTYIKPSLFLQEEGLNYLKIYWNSFKSNVIVPHKIEIYDSDKPDFIQSTKIGVITGVDSSRDITFWITQKPKKIKYYKIIVYYTDPDANVLSIESEYAIYDPSMTQFIPYRPDILSIFDNRQPPNYLDITWQAFLREPYTDYEINNTFKDSGKFLDKDVIYDFWITDDLSNFQDKQFENVIIKTIDATTILPVEILEHNVTKVGFNNKFYMYHKKNEDGTYTSLPISDNKVYYIKIIATKNPQGQSSKEAIVSYYVQSVSFENQQPITITKPILRIKKDSQSNNLLTSDSVVIEWDTKWFEIYDNVSRTWHSRVAVDKTSGKLLFDSDLDKVSLDQILYLNSNFYFENLTIDENILRIKAELVLRGALDLDLSCIRFQDLKSPFYELHLTPYENISKNGGYSKYLDILTDPKNDSFWEDIVPNVDGYTRNYQIRSLYPNTTYAIFLRPYIKNQDQKIASYYPGFISVTTLYEKESMDITPKVPLLEALESTDTSITIRFEYFNFLEYELSYSEILKDYPENGEIINWENLKFDIKIQTIDTKKYAYYKIQGLFPSTQYYIWIRGVSKNQDKINYSNWSNYVIQKTKNIVPPNPPEGLSIASKTNLQKYNNFNNLDLIGLGDNYVVLEWLKNVKDDISHYNFKETSFEKSAWLSFDEELSTFLIKFNKLISSKQYFVRAKTNLMIIKQKPVLFKYSYTIQICDNIDFENATTITVPSVFDTTSQFISAQSSWTQILKINTSQNINEHDGTNNNIYPLPSDDFEIIYDAVTSTLIHRFRSNKEDKSGKDDNNVDQRFISNLIKDQVYNYKRNISKYFDNNVENRIVSIPYSIFKTFEERKIDFTVVANNIEVTFPFGFLINCQLNCIENFGQNSSVEIIFNQIESDFSNYNTDSYVGPSQKISIVIKTPTTQKSIKSLEKYIDLQMYLPKIFSNYTLPLFLCYNDDSKKEFDIIDFQFDYDAKSFATNSNFLGTYAILNKYNISKINSKHFENLQHKLLFEDIGNFDAFNNVSNIHFNNILLAISQNKNFVKINSSFEDYDIQHLKKANIYAQDEFLYEENAINSLIRIYESIKGFPIKIQDFDFDLQNIDQNLKPSILKAKKIGLVDKNFQTKKDLTFDRLFYMLDTILSLL